MKAILARTVPTVFLNMDLTPIAATARGEIMEFTVKTKVCEVQLQKCLNSYFSTSLGNCTILDSVVFLTTPKSVGNCCHELSSDHMTACIRLYEGTQMKEEYFFIEYAYPDCAIKLKRSRSRLLVDGNFNL